LIVESIPGEADSMTGEVDGCGSMAGTKEEVVEASSKCDKCDKDKSCKCKDGDECKCDICKCEAEAEAGMDKSASANEFCKFGKLSPQNRKKVAEYWKNALGYPADYVSLMVKDYEK